MKNFIPPAPAGFSVDPNPAVPNGSVTAGGLAKESGNTIDPAYIGFKAGYSESYVADANPAIRVNFVLLRLASAATAQRLLPDLIGPSTDPADPTKPVYGTDAAIPGARTSDATAVSASYSDAYLVLAARGTIIMYANVYTTTVSPKWAAADAALALEQYRLLPP